VGSGKKRPSPYPPSFLGTGPPGVARINPGLSERPGQALLALPG